MLKFWGIEVKSGSSCKVQPSEGKILHLSQACLEDVKKDSRNDYIHLYAEKSGQKFVIGMLSPERFPHKNFDLVFEDQFTLSHDLKKGSVHFTGYEADNSGSPFNEDESDDDLEERVPIDALNVGKPGAKVSKPNEAKDNASMKPKKAQGNSVVKIVEPSEDAKKNAEDHESEDDEEEDDDDDDDESAEDEDMASSDAGTDEEDDSDDEEDNDEQTLTKPEPPKKRSGESSKTPVPEKKAKFSTPPQKNDGKKVSVHVATPHPAKQTGKTPANADNSNKQTPMKSFACPSCNKLFGSEQAVQSHSKAKHSSK